MRDAWKELFELVESAGARMTLDFGRSTARPCHVCGAPPPHELRTVGTWSGSSLPGSLVRGDPVDRPVCGVCWDGMPKEGP